MLDRVYITEIKPLYHFLSPNALGVRWVDGSLSSCVEEGSIPFVGV